MVSKATHAGLELWHQISLYNP